MIINQRKLSFLNFFKRFCVSERYIYNISKKTDTFCMLFHDLKNRYIGRAVLDTNPMYVRHALVVVNITTQRTSPVAQFLREGYGRVNSPEYLP